MRTYTPFTLRPKQVYNQKFDIRSISRSEGKGKTLESRKSEGGEGVTVNMADNMCREVVSILTIKKKQGSTLKPVYCKLVFV